MATFDDAVHRHFDPLANRYGLRFVTSTPDSVRFTNEGVFLQLMYDATRSFELRVEIGEILISTEQPENPFELSEVLKLHSAPETAYVERLQTNDPEMLVEVIKRLSELTDKYAAYLFEGKKADFIQLGRFRDKACAEYALSRDLKYARENAERAWLDKNYLVVVNTYKPFESELTAMENKRLAFAEKQIHQSNSQDAN